MKLDKNFLEKVQNPIYQVWDQIGHDILELEDVDNEECVETVIDASRLDTFGHKEAQELVSEAVKEHGYSKVLKFLCKNIKLY